LVDPAPAPEPEVSFSLVAPSHSHLSFGDLSGVVGRVDWVRLVVTANGESRETFSPGRMDRGVLRLRTQLGLEEATGMVEIRADLYYDYIRLLFRGQAVFDASDVAPEVRMEIIPVATRLVISGSLAFAAVGDTLPLTGTVYFMTGDEIVGADIEWTALDSVVEIISGNRAVARQVGSGFVLGSSLGAQGWRAVTVNGP
jgi:hypothetical protein